jgi:rfaE bifunctional protein kinase chain/domain
MERERLEQLLKDFPNKKIVVVGDVMLDEFTWGEVNRISPEAPVPVVEVIKETQQLGGSANVVANIKSLGGNPITIAVTGQDAAAERLRTLYRDLQIDSSYLIADDRRTTIKTRIIAHNQQLVRTDREDRTPLASTVSKALGKHFLEVLPGCDAVIVSDYDKGVVNPELLAAILPQAQRAGVPVFLDPKVHHANYYKPTTLITPNQREAELLSGKRILDTAGLEEVGRLLLDRFECPNILITRGREGMSLFEGNVVHHLPAAAREVFDVSGAGDTVIATLTIAASCGASMEEAARIANEAGGIVVGKIGTATVSPRELIERLRSDTPK